jgi:hypothetical protein
MMIDRLRAAAGQYDARRQQAVAIGQLRGRLATLPADAPATARIQLLVSLGNQLINAAEYDAAVAALDEARVLVETLPAAVAGNAISEVLIRLGTAHLRAALDGSCRARGAAACSDPVAAEVEAADAARRVFARILETPDLAPRFRYSAAWLHAIAAGDPLTARGDVDDFARFDDAAFDLGLATMSQAGGVVVDDFDGDDDLDVITSNMAAAGQLRVFAAGNGRYAERTAAAGVTGIVGGLHLRQADFDGDGDLDILVLRGAWAREQGRVPNSLLRNDGDLRFTDVTFAAGLADPAYPGQVGVWSDYDNDGDLDLFVGNEATPGLEYPSQLFRNQGDGTFVDVAAAAGVQNLRWSKGAAWGDYDGDGWQDLFVSNFMQPNRLYRNNRDGSFTDVAPELGLTGPTQSFSTWFWDANNDGHLDLLVNGYMVPPEVERLLHVWYAAASIRGEPQRGQAPGLYLGRADGTFRQVADHGIPAATLPMGSNFGDLDNDGWLDLYLGTGYPGAEGLLPNRLFRGIDGTGFAEITAGSGTGNLQKGHGVAFADLDGDGHQDIYAQMGGMYAGDLAPDAVYRNPGSANHWVGIDLRQSGGNRRAVGARVRADFTDRTGRRSVYRTVGANSSFGGNPLRLHLGLGGATRVDRLEVRWPPDAPGDAGAVTVFENLGADTRYRVRRGASDPEPF